MGFTRKQAQMIAEELHNLIRKDAAKAYMKIIEEKVENQSEEFISLKDAATLVGVSSSCMYKNKDRYGCYSKINGRIRFAKSQLKKVIAAGIY